METDQAVSQTLNRALLFPNALICFRYTYLCIPSKDLFFFFNFTSTFQKCWEKYTPDTSAPQSDISYLTEAGFKLVTGCKSAALWSKDRFSRLF